MRTAFWRRKSASALRRAASAAMTSARQVPTELVLIGVVAAQSVSRRSLRTQSALGCGTPSRTSRATRAWAAADFADCAFSSNCSAVISIWLLSELGNLTRPKPHLRNPGFLAQRPGRLQQHPDVLVGLRRGHVGFGHREVQRAPGVKELGLGPFEPCLGRGLSVAALAPNLEELVDGEDRVVTPLPHAVALGRRAGVVIHVNQGTVEGQRRIRELVGNDLLGGGRIHARGSGQQIPVLLESNELGFSQREPLQRAIVWRGGGARRLL